MNKLIKNKILKAHWTKPPTGHFSNKSIEDKSRQSIAKKRKEDQINKAVEFYKKCAYCGSEKNFTYIISKQKVECNKCKKTVGINSIIKKMSVEHSAMGKNENNN